MFFLLKKIPYLPVDMIVFSNRINFTDTARFQESAERFIQQPFRKKAITRFCRITYYPSSGIRHFRKNNRLQRFSKGKSLLRN
ncbi:hypothetical protein EN46_25600 [Citrobacter amalonaticus]